MHSYLIPIHSTHWIMSDVEVSCLVGTTEKMHVFLPSWCSSCSLEHRISDWHRYAEGMAQTERLERRRTTIILPKLMVGVKSENRYSNTMATMYDIHIFGRILESQRDKVIIDCIKLYNEGIHKQYFSRNIIGQIKSRGEWEMSLACVNEEMFSKSDWTPVQNYLKRRFCLQTQLQ
jgi:hypothetical protein